MCGIFFYNTETKTTETPEKSLKTVNEIFSSIKYRGPDSTNIELIDNLLFCHHRLAIINTNGGEQPIIRKINKGSNISGSIILIANGEIYNYKKFTTSQNDCEAIIDAYIINKLQDLDGDFAFVLYDQINGLIVTGRDQVGLKPLYIGFSQMGDIIAFASEMKVLEQINSVKSVCEHEINKFNRYSIDKKIINLHDSCSLINYEQQSYQQSYEQVCQTVRNFLIEATRKRINHTERPYAFLCSGGIDSVIIVSIAAQLGIPLHIFTLCLDSGNSYDEIHTDMFISDLKTKYNNIQYTKVKFTIQEGIELIDEVIKNLETYDPNTIRAAIPMYILAKYIKNNTDYKVILSGEGSDELFMGYNYFSIKNPTLEQAEKESLRLIKGLHSFDILRAERCFSCHGLELRVPFLDRELITKVVQISAEFRLPKNGVEKSLLRDSFKYLGIPDRILFRQKERMSDGVGFLWVQSLINYCIEQSGIESDKITTDVRMKHEKKYYENIYKKYYKFNTILFRELPDWANDNVKNELLIN